MPPRFIISCVRQTALYWISVNQHYENGAKLTLIPSYELLAYGLTLEVSNSLTGNKDAGNCRPPVLVFEISESGNSLIFTKEQILTVRALI